MPKKKLARFADIKTMDFVFEATMDTVKNDCFPYKGKWHKEIFKNNNPIVLELGCGKGEYSVGLGKKFPNKNFIGIDIKGARIWHGANTVREQGLQNIAFVRTRIDFVEAFFGPNEIDEIWLTFSDPQPKKPNKRLSSPFFIDRYAKFLKPGGIIHMKTDSSWLFAYTLEQIDLQNYKSIQKTWDLYGELSAQLDDDTNEILGIKTHYEGLFTQKGHKIKYVKFLIS
jgi:tRNA (guanine-N7-)-methyltransferase